MLILKEWFQAASYSWRDRSVVWKNARGFSQFISKRRLLMTAPSVNHGADNLEIDQS